MVDRRWPSFSLVFSLILGMLELLEAFVSLLFEIVLFSSQS